LQGETPKSNPGKKVTLVISAQFISFDFKDAPFVYVTRRQVAVGNQLAQPRASLFVVVVVVVQTSLPSASVQLSHGRRHAFAASLLIAR
jgi:hypothetical protein